MELLFAFPIFTKPHLFCESSNFAVALFRDRVISGRRAIGALDKLFLEFKKGFEHFVGFSSTKTGQYVEKVLDRKTQTFGDYIYLQFMYNTRRKPLADSRTNRYINIFKNLSQKPRCETNKRGADAHASTFVNEVVAPWFESQPHSVEYIGNTDKYTGS